MMPKKNKMAKVPKDWHERKRVEAKKLGLSTPVYIQLGENIIAKAIRKNMKRAIKFEIEIKK